MAKGSLPYLVNWDDYLQCSTCLAFPGMPCNGKPEGHACTHREKMPPDFTERFPVGSFVRLPSAPDVGRVTARVKRNVVRVLWRNGHHTEVSVLPRTSLAPAPLLLVEPDAITRMAFLSGEQPV